MKSFRLWLYSVVCRILPETRFFAFKVLFLRWCGAKVGENVRISSSARFYGGGELFIGDDVWIGSGDMIHVVPGARIKIGSCCDLGPEVMILTGSHEVDVVGLHVAGEGTKADVEIGDGCWLGARSMVLPGVVLAAKTLVAAGAVVTKSVSVGGSLIVGVPAEIRKCYS